MFGFLWRKPLIYDLWANIRLYWALADYFDSKKDFDSGLTSALASFGKGYTGPSRIKFIRYQAS